MESALAYIDVQSNEPFILFKIWYEEACKHCSNANVLSFATSSKDGYVTNRSLLLRKLENDGILLMTDRRSLKSAQISENNQCAIVFAWVYSAGDSLVNRQVRIEGSVSELNEERTYEELYEPEPFYCKIRSQLCHQGSEIKWQEHKEKHDILEKKLKDEGGVIDMPTHQIGYKVLANRMEFYAAGDTEIGDRVQFNKASNNDWSFIHIAA